MAATWKLPDLSASDDDVDTGPVTAAQTAGWKIVHPELLEEDIKLMESGTLVVDCPSAGVVVLQSPSVEPLQHEENLLVADQALEFPVSEQFKVALNLLESSSTTDVIDSLSGMSDPPTNEVTCLFSVWLICFLNAGFCFVCNAPSALYPVMFA